MDDQEHRENAFLMYARKGRDRVAAAPDGLPKIQALLDVIDELSRENPDVIARDAAVLKEEFRTELDRQIAKLKAYPVRAMTLLKHFIR